MNRKKIVILLMLITGVFYSNTLFNGFVWDDYGLVIENQLVKNNDFGKFFSPSYWKGINTEERERLRPVRTLTFMVDHLIYGERPWGYHLTNLLLHMLNVLLVYILGALLFKNDAAALAGALIFALHPVHVEAVSWVKNRSDLLCSAFMLGALVSMIRLEGLKKMLAVLTCFAGAFLSKEIAVILPIIMISVVYLYTPEEKRRKELVNAAVIGLLCVSLYVAKEVFWRKEITAETNIMMDAYIQMRIVLYTLSSYINVLLFPFNLSVEREINFDFRTTQTIGAGLIGFLGFGIYLLYKHKKSSQNAEIRNMLFSYIFMILALIPISNVVFLESRPIAEQRAYIPSIGFSMLAGLCAVYLIELLRKFGYTKHIKTAVAAGCLILLVLGSATFKRNFVWKDDLRFWKAEYKVNSDHYRVNSNLGVIYLDNKDYINAEKHFKTAAMNSDRPEVFYWLGICYDRLESYPNALAAYRQALNLEAQPYPDIYNNIGIVYEKMNRNKEAINAYEAALELKQDYKQARFNLAHLYEKQGKKELAKMEYGKLLNMPGSDDESRLEATELLAKLVRS